MLHYSVKKCKFPYYCISLLKFVKIKFPTYSLFPPLFPYCVWEHCLCQVWEQLVSSGGSSYLTRMSPDLGEISFLKAFPIWAEAKGSLPALNSNKRLKLTKIPWAVSGRKKLKINTYS